MRNRRCVYGTHNGFEGRPSHAASAPPRFRPSRGGPANGFRDALDFYAQCSSAPRLGAIRTPTLIIHAKDDPWIPSAAFRAIAWDRFMIVRLLMPWSGGHVGFHGCIWLKEGEWLPIPISAHLRSPGVPSPVCVGDFPGLIVC